MIFLLVPAFTLILIWAPAIMHYRAPRERITSTMVEAARLSPSDSVLEELRRFPLIPIAGRDGTLEVSVAEGILKGRLRLPDFPVGELALSFSPHDFDRLPPAIRLFYASFVVPDFLLAAYVDTGREEFFSAAREFIAARDQYERRAWLPRGLLWNDHATAASVRVLAEFWRVYRGRPDYQPEVGRAVLEQASRYGYFLSSPEHFTFSSNHGMMQNLGLLQLSLAFPELPQSAAYQRVAIERLSRQLTFFVGEDGIVRENSAGYQAFGLENLAMTFRTMTLLGAIVPAPWAERYRAGIDFLGTLRRPDGSLPAIGDTDWANMGDYPMVTEVDERGRAGRSQLYEAPNPRTGMHLHPVEGYWIDWAGSSGRPVGLGLSQAVVSWPTPPAPAHKHADEMSVHLWSGGVSWLTSVGYWPYTEEGRGQAEGWDGSNAPHVSGEDPMSQRTTRLHSFGSSVQLSAVDLERSGPGEYRARRQVVRVGPDLWLVLDLVAGLPDTTGRSVWTFSPEVELVVDGGPGSYRLQSLRDSAAFRIDYLGSPETGFGVYRGSLQPFAGWHVDHNVPQPAPAVVVEQPGPETWLAVVVSRAGGPFVPDRGLGRPRMARKVTAEEWAISVPTPSGMLVIERTGGSIFATRTVDGQVIRETLTLNPGPEVGPELVAVQAAFDSMSAVYPRFRPLWPERKKASYLVVLLLFGQEVVFLAVRRKWPRVYRPLRVVSLFCWAGLAAWLHFDLLRSWEVVTPSMGLMPFLVRRSSVPPDRLRS